MEKDYQPAFPIDFKTDKFLAFGPGLSKREYAAINIKNRGLIISRRDTPVAPVELLSLETTEKQEQPLVDVNSWIKIFEDANSGLAIDKDKI